MLINPFTHLQKNPIYTQKSPIYTQKSPVGVFKMEKVSILKGALQTLKRALYTLKRSPYTLQRATWESVTGKRPNSDKSFFSKVADLLSMLIVRDGTGGKKKSRFCALTNALYILWGGYD